ncbi:MAG TPA: response regulator [Rectinemataceae bacterium]|nr:response regulator [Rectinemataceae bacterium]
MLREAILCVDDEAIILLSIKQELKRHFGGRFLIETALDAAEASALVDELETRDILTVLVISDWMMPGMRGDQFLVELHRRKPHIKTVIITALASEDSERGWKEAGLHACIRKPWRSTELYATIEGCLASGGEADHGKE